MEESKVCARCGEDKPLTAFPPAPERKGGMHPYCRPCRADYNSTYYAANRDKLQKMSSDSAQRRAAAGLRQSTYMQHGLTDTEYLRVMADCRCALCGSDSTAGPGWNLDHDHSCCNGAIGCRECLRGVLCYQCNIAIGYAEKCIRLGYVVPTPRLAAYLAGRLVPSLSLLS